MKSQRRHDLESNKLADWIFRTAEKYMPHMRLIGISAAGLVAIIVAYAFYRGSRAASEGAAWRNFFEAYSQRDPKAMEDVAKDNAGSNVGLWAKQAAADSQLAEGMTKLYTDRDQANALLKEAAQNLQDIESAKPSDKSLLQRTQFALAQTYESMSDLEPAKKYYDTVAKASPETAIGKIAAERSKKLSDPETARWYEWFSRQKSKAPQPLSQQGTNGSLFGPSGSGILGDLPKTSDLPSLERQFSTPGTTSPNQPLLPNPSTNPTPESSTVPESNTPPSADNPPASKEAPAGPPTEPKAEPTSESKKSN